MPPNECNIQQLFARLRTAHFQSYLTSHGWVETSSSQVGQRRYESNTDDGDGVFEMYLPASTDVAQYQTRLSRNIYKLSGIEDREPAEIVREMFTARPEEDSPVRPTSATRLRVHNAGSTPMRVSVDSPPREHTLYANEAIELICNDSNSIEIQRSDDALIIRTASQR